MINLPCAADPMVVFTGTERWRVRLFPLESCDVRPQASDLHMIIKLVEYVRKVTQMGLVDDARPTPISALYRRPNKCIR